ncbi:MAG: hypothetical protein ACKO0W_06965 [Planctomycetota bacterium]
MAAKKRARSQARGAKRQTGPKAKAKAKAKAKPESRAARGRVAKPEIPNGARALPLAALRAALGTEVDRVRRHGGYTLILRRGKPVAAVIPFEEFRRYRMTGRFDEHERAERGARLIADIHRVREAIAQEWRERGRPPEADLSAAELISTLRDERTQQILDAARGRPPGDQPKHDDRAGGRG